MAATKNHGVGKGDAETGLREQILELKRQLKKSDAQMAYLRHQEAVLKDIFDTVQDGIAYATPGGKLISVNPALERILDVPEEKLIGKSILKIITDFLHPKDAGKMIAYLKRVISEKEIEPFQVAYRDRILDIRISINLKTRMLTGIIRDVTESRKATDALKRSEARLRRAELASKSGNWELHLDSGEIVGSEGAAKVYGLETESIAFESIKNIPLPEYRQMMDEALNDLITDKKPYNIEFRIRKADTGEIRDIQSVADFDPVNHIIYGAIQDITDRKKIERQIFQKNNDLTNLFGVTLHLLESIEIKDLLMKIVENASRLTGTDSSAIYLVEDQDLMLEAASPPLPEDIPQEFRKAKLNNHPHIRSAIDTRRTVIVNNALEEEFSAEERMIAESKDLRSLVYIPLLIHNHVRGVIILGTVGRMYHFEKHEIDLFSTFSNITSLALENSFLYEDLKETKEKAEESNKLKTAFLHNISHEIRTPLNAILGFSALLGQPNLPHEKIEEFIGIISQSNNQLLSVIEDILNISQIEARQVNLSEKPVNLSAIVDNLFAQYRPDTLKKGIDFIIRNSFECKDTEILTDEYKLVCILSSLINNAIKFTAEGTVELGCKLTDDAAEFYVSDTGIGIPESEQERIFERFYQIDRSTSRLFGGMGLGLSISVAYVEMLGGRLILSSNPGKGSTFSFTIPGKRKRSMNTGKRVNQDNTLPVQKTGRSVLVAEDEDSNYAFIYSVLKPKGYAVLRAFNGDEAIQICASDQPVDLVLMDIRMPVKDGYESAAEIRKIRPGLPVIAQTAYGYPDDWHVAFEHGCIDYITKPFSKEQLIALVKKYIGIPHEA